MTSSRRPAMALDAETLLTHSAWLSRLARALVARDDEIEDVVQQTYAQALDRPPSHATNVRGWLGTIARNVVRSNARSSSARVAREIAVPAPSPVETPVEAVERAELRRMVVESVLALDEPYRSTVILRFFEEQDVAVIARLTSAPEDTVRTRIRRGVQRVRELLERKVDDGSRGTADEGAAARAILFLRLREIAAGGGGGGATGSAAAARGSGRGAGSFVPRAISRRLVVSAAAAIAFVLAGSWWWMRRPASREQPLTEAAHLDPAAEPPMRSEPAPPTPAVVRNEIGPTEAPPPVPAPAPPPRRSTRRGTIRGAITDPDGNPVAGATVWAIASDSHEVDHTMPRFGSDAPALMKAPPAPGTNVTTSDGQGRYEFSGLSIVPAWHVGTYEPTLGATVSDLLELDSRDASLVCDLRLIPGTRLRGSVCDEDGELIGMARVELFSKCGEKDSAATEFSEPYGPSLGEFDAGFRCGETLELVCSAPGFLATERRKVDIARGKEETRANLTLRRRSGILVRGKIVDPAGRDFDLEEFSGRLLSEAPNAKYLRLSVWAIADGIESPPSLSAGAATAEGIVEGRVDFPAGRYDLVVPEHFCGSVELRLARIVIGRVPFLDPTQPPDLPCDEGRLPRSEPTTTLPTVTFVVQFVDEESKEPIDLEQHKILQLVGTPSSAPFFDSDVDLKRGLVRYRCAPGSRELVALLAGYAPASHRVEVQPKPTELPVTIELMKATAGAHGFAFRSDGRPLVKAPLGLFRPTANGMIDLLGPSWIATNGEGEFELEPLPAREHILVVSGQPDEAPAVERFVPTDPPTELTIHTVPGTATKFHVNRKGNSGKPSKPKLRILDQEGLVLEESDRVRAIRTEMPDDFVATLAPGRYSARVECSGFVPSTVSFEVPANAAIEIPLESTAPQSR